MSKRKIRIGAKKALIVLVVFLTLHVLFNERSPVKDYADEYMKPTVNEENINVHFIDVGQGSSVLIQQGTQGILIDSGEDSYSDELHDYIVSAGVEVFPYIIATHPHSDHIGGLDEVIEDFTVSKLIMPYIEKENEPDSKVYEELCQSVEQTKTEIIYPSAGENFTVGDSIFMEFLGPIKQTDDMNNMSLICKVRAFSTTFMFMGDAEKKEISSVYSTNADFDSDIIYVPHHGSDTSIHEDFLYDVSADVAVISCGEDNSYGHPHEETLDFYENSGAEIYRTDIDDNIVIVCSENGYRIEP